MSGLQASESDLCDDFHHGQEVSVKVQTRFSAEGLGCSAICRWSSRRRLGFDIFEQESRIVRFADVLEVALLHCCCDLLRLPLLVTKFGV